MRCLNCGGDGLAKSSTTCAYCRVYLPSLMRDILPHETLLEKKYHLDYPIGRGGFGITYRAMHIKTNRVVAIKEYYPTEYATRVTKTGNLIVLEKKRDVYKLGLQRFLSEAQTLARLNHPNIVRVQDFFEANNTAYMVMESIEGHTLTKELERQSKRCLEIAQIKTIYNALVEALNTAHAASIYHLDIKPDNVLLTPEARVVLIDFGGAKQGIGTDKNQSYTREYAPLEVVLGKEVGDRSDIFELGVMLYELLVGKRPPSVLERALNDTWDGGKELEQPWQTLVQEALHLESTKRPSSVKAWWELRGMLSCPYRGLSAFSEADQKYFFGREKYTSSVARVLQDKPIVAVVGASGSGKSSVVFAGVIPQFRKLGGWVIASFRPQERPFEQLAFALVAQLGSELEEKQRSIEAAQLASELRTGEQKLVQILAQIKERHTGKVLLVVDQFEELYTLCSDKQEQQQFIDQLLQAAESNECKILLTLRSDFLGAALEYRPLADALEGNYLTLSLMNQEELKQAIVSPAALMGVELEEGLVDRILKAVANSKEKLPLLEFALTQLWEKQTNARLSHQAYEEIGGVEEALALHAEKVYTELSESQQQKAQQIFVQLVHLGEGKEATRRVAKKEEVKDWDLVTHLASHRLVVTNCDPTTNSETVELVHEALIRNWSRWENWIEADRSFRLWQEGLREMMRQWERTKRHEGALLGGLALSEAQEWLAKRSDSLSITEEEYIFHSVKQQELLVREEEERKNKEQKQETRLPQAAPSRTKTLVGAAFFAVILGVFTKFQWQEAEKERLETEKQATIVELRSKTATVKDLLPSQPIDALVRAIEATGIGQDRLQSVPQETESVLHEGVDIARESNLLKHEDEIKTVAFSPDGNYIATGSTDKIVRLWDTKGNTIATFSGHEYPVFSVAFSPDGKYIASGSSDNTVRLWDTKGNGVAIFRGHQDWVYSVAFSPDGNYIVSGGNDRTIRLWDIKGNLLATFKGHQDVVSSVAFSPDGNYIASGSYDKTLRLWDIKGKSIATFRGHQASVNSVAFSPDGNYIASGSWDKTVRLWDIKGNLLVTFKGHQDAVSSVAFSPDGKYIASSGSEGNLDENSDKTVRLWDLKGNLLATFTGHEASVESVAFSPDGNYIASGSHDQTLRLWEIKTNLLVTLMGHQDIVNSVAFSSDGNYIASGSSDSTVRLWDAKGNRVATFKGHQYSVNSVAFSPDGNYIASGGTDRTIRLWDIKGNLLATFTGHQGYIESVAFSPDGKYIATGSWDRTLRLWDTKGNSIATFTGHQDNVNSVAFSPDGKYIASGSLDNTVRLWNLKGNSIATFTGHQGHVRSVAFSPDGKYIASGSDDQTISLWNVKGKRVATFTGHQDPVNSVAFSPDGKYIASSSWDKTVRWWDTKGKLLAIFTGHQGDVTSVAFSPDGKYLVSSARDNTVRLWNGIAWEGSLAIACMRLHYHPVFKQPETEEAKAAKNTCSKYVWKENS